MMQKWVLVFMVQFLALSLAFADSHSEVPQDLSFKGQPIDSLCFSPEEDKAKLIDLEHCGAAAQHYLPKGENEALIKKGFIGYDWQDSRFPAGPLGYSYYRYFSADAHRYWIYTINSGGGSGAFTALYLGERKDVNSLRIEGFAGGDRCNGGIEVVSSTHQQLSFTVNLTPYDLLTLSKPPLPELKAYDDLAACAACCFAKATYTVGLSLKPELSQVDLGDNSKISEMPEQGKYQACFNQLMSSAIAKGESILSQKQINALVRQFSEQCIR